MIINLLSRTRIQLVLVQYRTSSTKPLFDAAFYTSQLAHASRMTIKMFFYWTLRVICTVLLMGPPPSCSLSLMGQTTRNLVQRIRYKKGKAPIAPSIHGYVPDGLTSEQYIRIKQEEIARKASMDYGAWGPRFKRTNTPGGDWMIMPQLWTHGFMALPTVSANNRHEIERHAFKQIVYAFLLAVGAVHSIIWTFASMILRQRTYKVLILSPNLRFWVVGSTLLSVLLIPTTSRLLERMNRLFLWSRRRTLVTSYFCLLVWELIWNFFLIPLF